MCKSVQDTLQKVDEARYSHDGAVDSTECLETEDLSAVVGDTRVKEWTVCNEDEHIDCSCQEGVLDNTEDPNEQGDAQEGAKDDRGWEVVEEHSNEGDGNNTSEWQSDVKETVKSIC